MTTDYDLYNGTPPHVEGSDTSLAAAESVTDDVGRLCGVILALVKRAGTYGVTCDECEKTLLLKHQTASARLRELVLRDLIRDSGTRRLTRSRRQARVYVACKKEG